MIVVAPSIINGKPYVLLEDELTGEIDELADLPQWVADLAGKVLEVEKGDAVFEPLYTAEEFERLLNLIPVESYDGRHDPWLELMLACTHASTVDDGEEAFMKWTTKDGPGNRIGYASDFDMIAARWRYNYAKRNMKGGRQVGSFNMAVLAAAPGATVKIPGADQGCADTSAEADFGADPITREDEAAFEAIREAEAARMREQQYSIKDFVADLSEENSFIFTKTGEAWPGQNVNRVVLGPPKIDPLKANFKNADECELFDGTRDRFLRDKVGEIVRQSAAEAIISDRKQRVACLTWWPGKPAVILNTLVNDGGAVPLQGMNSFNRYRPPRLIIGKHPEPTPWLDHVKLLYPDDWQHIINWLASRVQHPEIKILHALVLGGPTRIGKDTLLKPVSYAIGPWNFSTVGAQTIMDEPKYNGYLEAVICLISEARDFGDQDRYGFL